MRSMNFSGSGRLLGALLLVPGMLLAVKPSTCTAGEPTAASYTWNFSREANNLFDQLHADAYQVSNHADHLRSLDKNTSVDWRADLDQLTTIKHAVNDMGQKLCRLETIRRVVQPWQKNVIDRDAAAIRLMADNTTDAINYLNGHHDELWVPTYRQYATNLYNESSQLSTTLSAAVNYARVHNEEQKLAKTLNMKPSA